MGRDAMAYEEFKYNMNMAERDGFLFRGKRPQYLGGIECFDNLPIGDLELLLEFKYADPSEQQNDAYRISEFMAWAQEMRVKYPDVADQIKFIGYAVSKQRNDYRVSVEGIDIKGNPNELPDGLVTEFAKKFSRADEFRAEKTGCNCWYD
jgi:hypothetical protein